MAGILNLKVISPDTINSFDAFKTALERAGYSVEQINSVTEDDYHGKRRRWDHNRLRFKMQIGFPIKVIRALWPKPASDGEIRIISNPPLFLPFIVNLVSRKDNILTVHILYDIYPEALVQAGILTKPEGSLVKLLKWFARYNLEKSSATVFMGEHLQHFAEEQYGKARQSAIIPTGSDGRRFRKTPPAQTSPSEPIRVLYSGTMGHMHEIGTLLELFRKGIPDPVTFLFNANGVGYNQLKEKLEAGGGNAKGRLVFRDILPDREWHQAMHDAQIGLVTMVKGGERVCMPSKVYSCMMAGQAILAICQEPSDLSDTVREHDCGWVVEPGDVHKLSAIMHEIINDRELLHRKRMNAYEAGYEYYDLFVLYKKWIRLFNDLQQEAGSSL